MNVRQGQENSDNPLRHLPSKIGESNLTLLKLCSILDLGGRAIGNKVTGLNTSPRSGLDLRFLLSGQRD